MKWSYTSLAFLMGCSSWELTHAEKSISQCWFSQEDPTPIDNGIDWGLTAADMNVGYDFPYDGIDQNCDGAEEFDLDGDGFVPAPFAEEGQADCWDTPISPLDGITGEMIAPSQDDAAYDGIDQDCDGQLDFDQDGDGFGSEEYAGQVQYRWSLSISEDSIESLKLLLEGKSDEEKQQTIDLYFASFEQETEWDGGDCWDDPSEEKDVLNDFDSLTSADVFPSAEERYYDGIDQDCDGSSDFDQDGDGFASSLYTKEDGLVGEDCNDSDENLFPNPDIEEIYYNGIDDNCDNRDQDGDQDGDGFWDSAYWTFVSEETVDISVQLPADDLISDCNDMDALIYPDATERCNGIDDSCDDTLIEEEFDADGDGFVSCMIDEQGWLGEFSDGFELMLGEDCNDDDVIVYPQAPEIYGDGVDQSCDGFEVCYLDVDLDGFRSDEITQTSNLDCSGTSENLASVALDCDDGSASTYPGAAYLDSTVDCMLDDDGDGFGSESVSSGVVSGNDCNDGDVSINPSATEVCDGGIDNDCDTQVDDDDSSLDLSTGTTHYADNDVDGFGDIGDVDTSCSIPSGRVSDNTDCDDADALINPSTIWHQDLDEDTFGGSTSVVICDPGQGYVLQDGDCNDGDVDINPDATEVVADGIDQNCDTFESCYRDDDGDTFGGTFTELSMAFDFACLGSGLSSNDTDCDDGSASTYPGAAYLDSTVDCMLDGDGDGFGSESISSGVISGNDCNDGDVSINPSATEVCDGGIDNDCDTQVDDDDSSLDLSTGTTHYADNDVDGFGDIGDVDTSCSIPSGRVSDNTDCNDADALINPSTIWYIDDDGDGFGSVDQTLMQCSDPAGFVLNSDDCEDGDPEITEGWSWYLDVDGDGLGIASDTLLACSAPVGYTHRNGDCDDADIQNASVCLDVWVGTQINGAGAGILHNNDRDRFASTFAMGEVHGTMLYGFGAPNRKYDNVSDKGGVFLFDDLATMSTEECSVQIDPVGGGLRYFGTEMLIGEDFTGDGQGDLLVSSYVSPPSIYIYDGIDVENALSQGALDEQDALYTLDISSMNNKVGSDIFWEDITGDQQPDLIFNQPGDASITIVHSNLSSMTIQNTTVSSDYIFIEGEDPTDQFGLSFDLTDIDQDNQLDLIAGDPKFNGDDGRVYIRLGPVLSSSGNTSIGTGDLYIDSDSTNSKPRLGTYIKLLDLDSDGIEELIVSERRDKAPQAIFIYNFASLAQERGFSDVASFLSATSSLSSSVDSSLTFISPSQKEFDILSVSMIDGYLAIAAPKYNGEKGIVALFSYEDRLATHNPVDRQISFEEANAHLFIYNNTTNKDRLGSIVENVGDVTGDGHDDLLIGARMENGGEGIVRILPGPF